MNRRPSHASDTARRHLAAAPRWPSGGLDRIGDGVVPLPDRPYGMTLQVEVSDLAQARAFYTALLGSAPEYEPHEDFVEWRVVPGGETWLQVVAVSRDVRPLTCRVRFGVANIQAERDRLAELGVQVSPVRSLPGVVAFTDFADPWGNALGLYQDLAPSGQQPVVGGSARDPSLFVDG